MMRYWKIAAITIIIMLIAACGNHAENGQTTGFVGYIVKKEGDRILVVSDKEQDFSANGGASHYYEAIWFSNAGKSNSVGDRVVVRVDGGINASYPGQGRARSVKVIRSAKPEGAKLTEAEAIRRALISPEIVDVIAPVVKSAEFDASSREWRIAITSSGDVNAMVVKVADIGEEKNLKLGIKPPIPVIRSEDVSLTIYQSSYCWDKGTVGECRDYVAPAEMLKEKAKDRVKAGAKMIVRFDSKPPTEVYLSLSHDGVITQYDMDGDSFLAPKEPGIYYGSISATWLVDKEKRVSEGSSSYAFAIEVTE
ncbi:DUF3221 domain-containing protein [Cohnella terricola]|uniref:DUF3221 domain-containing protein n=1 Tax=Cohnella terricola TaxID=1289167 RepID=A0A559JDR8_9BACL|nr:DUF3221 domain-containing protein [Cohnella terricola]TVX98007.1 DUF3221 domain-containing protein [Cohnella terricola]